MPRCLNIFLGCMLLAISPLFAQETKTLLPPVEQQVTAEGTYYTVTYAEKSVAPQLEFGVTYTLWLPADIKQVRGIIVHQHGCGAGACAGGKTAAYDMHWQALAKKWNCALLGPSYHQPDKANCRLWCDPRNGSNEAFLACLQQFATASHHAEIETAPWCLWGHSGGGMWASIMHTLHAERIVAIWFRSGTAYGTWEKGEIPKPELSPAVYQVPAMLNPGAKEKDDKRFGNLWNASLDMFHAYRTAGAPIGFAPDPKTVHECGDSRYLAIPFFDACLAQRLPADGAKDMKLKAVDTTAAWLAPVLGNEAHPAEKFMGDKHAAVWLPNAAIAQAWSEYVATGATSDITPPAAPTHVQVDQNPKGSLRITWRCQADFESGVQQFTIERNGVKIAAVPEKPVGRFGRALFQTMSYHDTPEKELPAMEYVDADIKPGETYTYTVRVTNSVGLTSEPSSSFAFKP